MIHNAKINVNAKTSERVIECCCGYTKSLGWFPSQEKQTQAALDHLSQVNAKADEERMTRAAMDHVALRRARELIRNPRYFDLRFERVEYDLKRLCEAYLVLLEDYRLLIRAVDELIEGE